MTINKLKHGDIVRFAHPEKGEETSRMVVRENRDDRVLVAHMNTGMMTPTSVFSVDDLIRVQSVATGLANAFSNLLCTYLTPEQIAQANADNVADGDPRVCHSHDYIDANEVMAEAWVALFGFEIDLQNDDMRVLWGDAWDAAKAAGFHLIKEDELA
jgi:hypothetical protein